MLTKRTLLCLAIVTTLGAVAIFVSVSPGNDDGQLSGSEPTSSRLKTAGSSHIWGIGDNQFGKLTYDEALEKLKNGNWDVADLRKIRTEIMENYGVGERRFWLIDALYRNVQGSDQDIFDSLTEFEFADDERAAILAIRDRVAEGDMGFCEGEWVSTVTPGSRLEFTGGVLGAARNLSLKSGDIPAELERSGSALDMLLHDNPQYRVQTKVWLLQALGEKSPDAVMAFLATTAWFTEGQADRVTDEVLQRIAKTAGPEKVINIAAKNGISPIGAIKEWISLDVEEAHRWVSEQPDEMVALAAGPFASRSIELQEIETARAWIEKIGGEDPRKAVEAQLRNTQQKMIRKSMNVSPEHTLEAIVDGQSVHGEEWIGEAFQIWAKSDSEKSNYWYQANQNSLGRDAKAQIIQASAQTAIERGDIANAQEWVERIGEGDIRDDFLRQITIAKIKAERE